MTSVRPARETPVTAPACHRPATALRCNRRMHADAPASLDAPPALRARALWRQCLSIDDLPRRQIGQPGFSWRESWLDAVAARPGGNLLCPRPGLQVQFDPASADNLVVAGPLDIARLVVSVKGRGNVVLIGRSHKFAGRVTVVGDNNLLFIGEGSTCNDGHFVLRSDGCSIVVGDDAMMSFEVGLRCCDMHGIFSIDDLSQINPPRSVLVGPHVWLGEGSLLLKGVSVGAGSVVGARSVVSTDLPGRCVAVGTPARVLREGVSWTRQPQPDADDCRAVLARLPAA